MFIYTPGATHEDQSKPLWNACLISLQSLLPITQIDLWLRAIEPLSLIEVHNANRTQLLFTCQTKQSGKINSIISQYQNLIQNYCTALCGHTVQWSLLATAQDPFNNATQANLLDLDSDEITTEEWTQQAHKSKPTPLNHKPSSTTTSFSTVSLKDETLPPLEDDPIEQNHHAGTGLNGRLSFEHFVVGKANQMAHAAAQHVAHHPGTSYNPFFLYGGVGLGKTHLVHAVGNTVLANNPNARIRYIHANQFIADVVSSYRRQTFDAFKRYYHSLDVLLIDDIQFFADKKRTQEEFFYAFESLVANRSQIILTSDTYPKDLADIENRLISRFNAGLVATIDPPELEMRVAILYEKAKGLSIDLKEDIAFYIAKNLRSNVRELEGALHKLLAYSRFQGNLITLDLTKMALRDIISGPRHLLSVDMIQKAVADYYKVKLSDMLGKRRLASIVLPRQVAMYLSKELTQKSLPDIGECFGGRDHTTVLHSIRKIAQEKTNNPQLNHQVNVILQTLGG